MIPYKFALKALENKKVFLINQITWAKTNPTPRQERRKLIQSIDIGIIIANIESNKSLVSALATSLLKKIITPSQDIRLHRTDFDNGYCARVLDAYITSHFFKDYFPKYANKESTFLTLATREEIKWIKQDGKNLKIRDPKLKEAFLNILDQIETHK